jgi:hypothetical protein
MFDGGHRWTFTDLGDGSTRIDHELEMRPKGIFKLMGPMMRANGEKNRPGNGRRLAAIPRRDPPVTLSATLQLGCHHRRPGTQVAAGAARPDAHRQAAEMRRLPCHNRVAIIANTL